MMPCDSEGSSYKGPLPPGSYSVGWLALGEASRAEALLGRGGLPPAAGTSLPAS